MTRLPPMLDPALGAYAICAEQLAPAASDPQLLFTWSEFVADPLALTVTEVVVEPRLVS